MTSPTRESSRLTFLIPEPMSAHDVDDPFEVHGCTVNLGLSPTGTGNFLAAPLITPLVSVALPTVLGE